jgi:hypothetical protein
MAEASCLDSSLNLKKKNAIPMRGFDLRCRKAYCMDVEHNVDLPHPAKPFSHRKDLGFASQAEKGPVDEPERSAGMLHFVCLVVIDGGIRSLQPVANRRRDLASSDEIKYCFGVLHVILDVADVLLLEHLQCQGQM